MSAKWWATSIDGGASGSLDSLNPLDMDGASDLLVVGDVCVVTEEDTMSHYVAKSASGQSEDAPKIIIPDVNPSDWYWELVERVVRNEGMTTALLYGNIAGGL